MVSRYDNRAIFKNTTDQYYDFRDERKLKFINHYETATFKELTPEDVAGLELVSRIWSQGDRYYKLAYKYYGDSKLWWIIAWFNLKPTEAHVQLGDIIHIPLPLEKVLSLFTA